jgi:hypothetical protein
MDTNTFINQLAEIGIRQTRRTGETNKRTMRLGDPTQTGYPVIVPPNQATQKGMMYVHTHTSSGYVDVQQALNDGVFTTFDDSIRTLEVEVGYVGESPVLRILRLASTALEQTGGASPQQIASRRANLVTPGQYQELKLTPTTPPSLLLNITGGKWRIGNRLIATPATTDWIDLTSNVPGTTGQARYVLVAIDPDNAPLDTNGTAFDSGIEIDPTLHVPVTAEAESLVLGWVRLENGQTTIDTQHIIPFPELLSTMGIVPLESGGNGVDTSAWLGAFAFYQSGLTVQVRCVGDADSPPTANDDESEGFNILSRWSMSVTAGGLFDGVWECTDASNGAAVWKFLGAAYSEANLSATPTDAELDAAFGAPATLGVGFTGVVNDNGGGAVVYHVATDNVSWFYTLMIQAV